MLPCRTAFSFREVCRLREGEKEGKNRTDFLVLLASRDLNLRKKEMKHARCEHGVHVLCGQESCKVNTGSLLCNMLQRVCVLDSHSARTDMENVCVYIAADSGISSRRGSGKPDLLALISNAAYHIDLCVRVCVFVFGRRRLLRLTSPWGAAESSSA